jgi:MYXO-CTERM domain-containing protein
MPKYDSRSKHFKLLFPLLAATTTLLLSQGEAKALNLKTFDLQGSPEPGSQGAINGKITLDLDSISLQSGIGPIPAWATDLSVVVAATGGTDGTFAQSNFNKLIFENSGTSFDFNRDLIGQNGWGTTCIGGGCDFNLFSFVSGAPTARAPFKFETGNNQFLLTKFAPAGASGPTPTSGVPGPLPLLGVGAAFGWSRRLRKRIATPLITPPQA